MERWYESCEFTARNCKATMLVHKVCGEGNELTIIERCIDELAPDMTRLRMAANILCDGSIFAQLRPGRLGGRKDKN
jgi:hypothetical protein